MDSIFSASAKQKFGRDRKPLEFAKKRSEVTPRLDEEEQAREDQRAARKLEKKAKRKVKPRKGESQEAPDIKKDSQSKEKSKSSESASPSPPPSSSLKKSESTPQTQSRGGSARKSKSGNGSKKNGEEEGRESPEPSTLQPPVGNGKDARTVFMGNVPISETEKSLVKFCSEFGEVESVRLRSLPVAGTAVDEAGNQDLVRKVCAIKKKFGSQKGSLNAYVVFKRPEAVQKALAANNRIMGKDPSKDGGEGKQEKGRHLRVDLVNPTLFDPSLSVFVGGIPLYCDEEELREHFAEALSRGQKDVCSVRIVRDPDTLLGKGFAYLLLSDKDAVMQALTLHQKKYRKRWALRVTVCGKRTKRVKKNESGGSSSSSSGSGSGSSNEGRGKKRPRAGDEDETNHEAAQAQTSTGTGAGTGTGAKREARGGEEKAEKKARWRDLGEEELAAKKARVAGAVNAVAAAKRISRGSAKVQKNKSSKNTRQSVLAAKGQTKTKKERGRKGKRLGGNVKKAMKVAAAAKTG